LAGLTRVDGLRRSAGLELLQEASRRVACSVRVRDFRGPSGIYELADAIQDASLQAWVLEQGGRVLAEDGGGEAATLKALAARWGLALPEVQGVSWEAVKTVEARRSVDPTRSVQGALVAVSDGVRLGDARVRALLDLPPTRIQTRLAPPPPPRGIHGALAPVSVRGAVAWALAAGVLLGLVALGWLMAGAWGELLLSLLALCLLPLILLASPALFAAGPLVRSGRAGLAVVREAREVDSPRDGRALQLVTLSYRAGDRVLHALEERDLDLQRPRSPGERTWVLVSESKPERWLPFDLLRERRAELALANSVAGGEGPARRVETLSVVPERVGVDGLPSAGETRARVGASQVCPGCLGPLGEDLTLMCCLGCDTLYHRACLGELRSCVTRCCRNNKL
jgi:hypothetical protein